MSTTAERIEVVKAALADAGVNPDAVLIDRKGIPRWRTDMVDVETAWRAGEIGRQWAQLAPKCFTAFKATTFLPRDETEHRHRLRDECQAAAIFTMDCGAHS